MLTPDVPATKDCHPENSVILSGSLAGFLSQTQSKGLLFRAGRFNEHASPYTENEEPQPQDFVEFGLMKLKPWRISVAS